MAENVDPSLVRQESGWSFIFILKASRMLSGILLENKQVVNNKGSSFSDALSLFSWCIIVEEKAHSLFVCSLWKKGFSLNTPGVRCPSSAMGARACVCVWRGAALTWLWVHFLTHLPGTYCSFMMVLSTRNWVFVSFHSQGEAATSVTKSYVFTLQNQTFSQVGFSKALEAE